MDDSIDGAMALQSMEVSRQQPHALLGMAGSAYLSRTAGKAGRRSSCFWLAIAMLER
ncbi:MAG: hypothetical protein AAFY11_00965 [Cyanobacteria bacterium J06641_5]